VIEAREPAPEAETHQVIVRHSKSQSDAAHQVLLGLIVSMRVPPGAHLSEQELTRLSGYGRTPSREALQRLEIEGFCTVLPRRGILVAPLDIRRQTEVWEMRMELEPVAARLAAERHSEEEVAQLKVLLAEGYTYLEERQRHFAATAAIDERLHLETARASGNELLINQLTLLYAHAKRQWVYQNRRGWRPDKDIVDEWSAILEALQRRDGQASYDLLRAHVANSQIGLAFGF